jgi:hypothetical protein
VGQPTLVQLRGAVVLSPVPGCGGGSVTDTMQLQVSAAYGASASAPGMPVNAVDASPLAIPLQGIVAVRFLSIKSLSGAQMKLLVSSPNGGDDQVVPFTDLVLHCAEAGTEMTALKLVGSGSVSYLIAGDAG